LECPERVKVESRNKSKSSLILGYLRLRIQCHAFSVRIDVFSTMMVDISNFYLMTPFKQPEYIYG
jgi:hypothetical protein